MSLYIQNQYFFYHLCTIWIGHRFELIPEQICKFFFKLLSFYLFFLRSSGFSHSNFSPSLVKNICLFRKLQLSFLGNGYLDFIRNYFSQSLRRITQGYFLQVFLLIFFMELVPGFSRNFFENIFRNSFTGYLGYPFPISPKVVF